MFRFGHHHFVHPHAVDCRHRIHPSHLHPDDTICYCKREWLRTFGPFMPGIVGSCASRVPPSAPSCFGGCNRPDNPTVVTGAPLSHHPGPGSHHTEPERKERSQGPATRPDLARTSSDPGYPTSTSTTTTTGARGRPRTGDSTGVPTTSGSATCRTVRGFACSCSAGSQSSSPHETRTRKSRKTTSSPVTTAEAVASSAESGQKDRSEPPSPLPSPLPESLFAAARLQTPGFVKHESIQTSVTSDKDYKATATGDSKPKPAVRSAFSVIKPASLLEIPEQLSKDETTKVKNRPTSEDPSRFRRHTEPKHQHHFCWKASAFWHNHQCKHACMHRCWNWQNQHGLSDEKQKSKPDSSETTCAGFFVNISKDELNSMLHEAWKRITNVISNSRGTLLLDRMPEDDRGRLRESNTAVRWHEAFCADEQSSHVYRDFCNTQNHGHDEYSNCNHEHRGDDENYFYPADGQGPDTELSEGRRYSIYDDGPDEFYDCFECMCSSHQCAV